MTLEGDQLIEFATGLAVGAVLSPLHEAAYFALIVAAFVFFLWGVIRRQRLRFEHQHRGEADE